MHFAANNGAKKVLMVWISAIGLAATALMGALAGFFTAWLLIAAGISGIITVFAALWYPPRYAATLQGDFDGTAVRAVKGVLWQRELFVPMAALRTFETSATPIQRLFGCRTITLRFAGGAAILPLLPAEQAKALTEALENCEE